MHLINNQILVQKVVEGMKSEGYGRIVNIISTSVKAPIPGLGVSNTIRAAARDSWFVSLFTFGEGYHNYHHKFPSDFRNGVSWLAFDPSKWLISFFSLFGVTKKLIRTQDFIILRTKCDVIYGKLQKALNTSDVILQDSYNNRVESLFKSANEILLQWQEMDIKLKKNGVYIQRKLFRKYQKEVKRILKDLRCILRELSKDTVDISYHL